MSQVLLGRESMVDRVAMALFAIDNRWPDYYETIKDIGAMGHDPICETFRDLARAAIQALRDPTDEMTRAGIDNCAMSIRQERAGSRQMTTLFEDEVGEMWQAMIDEALKP